MNKTVLIVGDNPQNVEYLVGGLVGAGFQVATALDGSEAWEKINQYLPDLVISEVDLPDIDGFQLLNKIRENPNTRSIPLIFLTSRGELQDKIRGFQLGAKDYIVKPLSAREIVARVKMVLGRISKRRAQRDQAEGRMMGRLEEMSPVELIQNLGMERKTGILTLTNENNKNGQIFFKNGCVVNAILGNFRAEKAVYQMLSWERGDFCMVFQDVDVADEIPISNLGLVIEGLKRLEKREELMRELPSPGAIFTLDPDFLKFMEKKKLTPELARFIQLFDGRRDVLKIIDDSYYDDLTTLERIVKLYKQGVLREIKEALPRREMEGEPEELLTSEEFETFFQRIIKDPEKKEVKVLVLGTAGSGKTELIRSLTWPGEFRMKKLKGRLSQSLEVGKTRLKDRYDLTLIGVPVERELIFLFPKLLEGASGHIVLVNALEPEDIDYMRYLIKSIRDQCKIPYAIGVTNLRKPGALDFNEIKHRLGLEELTPCYALDGENAKKILLEMREPEEAYEDISGGE